MSTFKRACNGWKSVRPNQLCPPRIKDIHVCLRKFNWIYPLLNSDFILPWISVFMWWHIGFCCAKKPQLCSEFTRCKRRPQHKDTSHYRRYGEWLVDHSCNWMETFGCLSSFSFVESITRRSDGLADVFRPRLSSQMNQTKRSNFKSEEKLIFWIIWEKPEWITRN